MTAALVDRTTARQPAGRGGRPSTRPRLRVLDQVALRRRARYRNALLFLLLSVLAGFFAVAFVHAELVAGQHDLDAMRAEIAAAEAHHAELARAVEEASAPDVIVTRARELGMVRSSVPVYLAAAAPVRPVEVRAALPATIASEGPESDVVAIVDAAGVDPAVAPSAATSRDEIPGTDRALRGSLGTTGGISAAIRLPASSASTGDPAVPADPLAEIASPPSAVPPSITVGSPAGGSPLAGSPVGAVTSTPGAGISGATGSSGRSGAETATLAPSPSIAGSRAVSSTTKGATASTSTDGMASAAAATGAG